MFTACTLCVLLTLLSLDIVFTGDDAVLPDSAINNNYVTDFDTLKAMGDEFMTDLVNSLGLSVSDGSGSSSSSSSATATPTQSSPASSCASSSNITVTVEIDGVARKFIPA